jgi:trans-2,3-dihydro-3-hydroxyanthranilate isomerase
LDAIGELGDRRERNDQTFEDKAGLVPMSVDLDHGRPVGATLAAPARPHRGADVDPPRVAAALSLNAKDLGLARHAPCVAGAPVDFLFVALRDGAALARIRLRGEAAQELLAGHGAVGIYAYARDSDADAADFRARTFAPGHGIAEDPATGAAAAAFAGLQALLDPAPDCAPTLRIAQGLEMGRPSVIEAQAEKAGGEVLAVRVGGGCVLMAEGEIEVPDPA